MGFKSLLLVSSHAPYSVLIVPPPYITLTLSPCSVVPRVCPRSTREGGNTFHVQVTTCPGRTAGINSDSWIDPDAHSLKSPGFPLLYVVSGLTLSLSSLWKMIYYTQNEVNVFQRCCRFY